MKLHPSVTHLNGIVTVAMTAQFVGDATDADDKTRIQAYGDPKVNLGGAFTDPLDNTYTFSMPSTDVYVGIVNEMLNKPARFMKVAPTTGQLGPLDLVIADPVHASTVWSKVVQTRCQAAITSLRALTPPQLTTLPDQTV